MVIFSSFFIQYKQIKKILNTHWKVLQSDRFLSLVLPERVGVIFRGARSIQGEIAPNTIDPPKTVSFFQQCKGYYPCRKCNVCLHNRCGRRKTYTFQSTITLRSYKMKHFLLAPPQYVRCTIRTFSVRINGHLANIKRDRTNRSVPRHYLKHHGKDPTVPQFQIIDKFAPHWKGDSCLRGLSCLQTYWIYELKSYSPFGMNVDWDINCFINQA